MRNPWFIVVLVLVVLSLILAIMDRSFLQPMYLLVLALVVMLGTNAKFPWGEMVGFVVGRGVAGTEGPAQPTSRYRCTRQLRQERQDL